MIEDGQYWTAQFGGQTYPKLGNDFGVLRIRRFIKYHDTAILLGRDNRRTPCEQGCYGLWFRASHRVVDVEVTHNVRSGLITQAQRPGPWDATMAPRDVPAGFGHGYATHFGVVFDL